MINDLYTVLTIHLHVRRNSADVCGPCRQWFVVMKTIFVFVLLSLPAWCPQWIRRYIDYSGDRFWGISLAGATSCTPPQNEVANTVKFGIFCLQWRHNELIQIRFKRRLGLLSHAKFGFHRRTRLIHNGAMVRSPQFLSFLGHVLYFT